MFEDFAGVFDRLADEALGRTFIETSFVYVYWVTDLTKEQVVAIFRRISRRTGTIAMTTAERLINEGIEKGIEQGIEQATVRHVKSMLKLGMDAGTISAALELPMDKINTLLAEIKSGKI